MKEKLLFYYTNSKSEGLTKFVRNITLLFIFCIGIFNPIVSLAQGIPELMYYRFNTSNAGTTPNDAPAATRVGAANGTILGTTLSVGGTGQFGSALTGTGGGTTDYITTGWNTDLINTDWTLSFWINNAPSSTTLWYLFGDAGNSFRCFINGAPGQGNMRLTGTGLPTADITGVTGGAYVIHFVRTISPNQITAYKNGVAVGTFPITGTPTLGTGLRIGSYTSGSALNGQFDEFRIYNRALTATEVSNTWNSSLYSIATSNNASAYRIVAPTNFCSGLQPVSVRFKNTGNNIIYNVNVAWTLDGVLQNPVSWNYPLDTLGGQLYPSDTVVKLGDILFTNAPHVIKAWTESPNFVNDVTNNDDTISTTLRGALNGTYTIGGVGANYSSIIAAVNDLNTFGVCGPVIFNVNKAAGPYSGSVNLTNINGTSATNTIRFNGNGAVISSTVSPIVSITNVSYLTLDSFDIDGGASYAGFGVYVGNQSHHLTFTRNIIRAGTTSTSTSNAGFVSSGSSAGATTAGNNAQYITFTNNTVIGGYYSATFMGNTGSADNYGHYIANNTFRDFYLYGVYFANADTCTLLNNDINRATRATVSTLYGIYMATSRFIKIQKNRLHDFGADSYSAYPMYITNMNNSVGYETEISNNLIYNIGQTSGIFYGIYSLTTAFNNVNIYHNTVTYNVPSASTSAIRSIFLSIASTGVNIYNNIFTISGAGSGVKTGIYVTNAGSVVNSNYNTFYLTSTGTTTLGYWNGAVRNTLADWQTASNQDLNSNTINPQFTNLASGNLKPLSQSIDNKGTPIAAVTTDILNAPRSSTIPDVGAYEFSTLVTCTGTPNGGTATSASTYACANQPVTLSLTGATVGDGITYQWMVSSTGAVGSYSPLLFDTLSTVNVTQTSTSWYMCVVTCQGVNQANSAPIVIRTSSTPLTGTYTINKNAAYSSTNFVSFKDLLDELYCVGVTGTVDVNVVSGSGPYLTTVEFKSFPNASSTNNIRIHGNNVIINGGSATPILRFDGASYYTLDSFRVQGDASFSGIVVSVGNQSHHLTFTKNTFNAGTTSTATSNAVFASSGSNSTATTAGNNAQYITLTNNTLIGGYYSATFMGNTGSADNYGHYIANNTFRDFYLYGVYFANADTCTLLNNDINRATRATVSTLYGIYMATSRFVKIQKNRLHDFGADSYSAYPMYITNMNNSVGYETEISNNLIYNIGQTSGIFYGIYSLTTAFNNVNIYHNTIAYDVPSASTSAIRSVFLSVASTGVNIYNNIFSISGGGTGIKTGIYVTNAGSVVNSNYNTFYLTSTGTTNVGYWNTAERNSLSDWQTASNQDLNSNTINPQYANLATGNLRPLSTFIDNKGTPIAAVTTDILNATRSSSTPDVGAYEFSNLLPCTGTPNAGTATASVAFACSTQSVLISLTGSSLADGLSYQWYSSSTGTVGSYSPMLYDTLSTLTVTQNSTTWYMCAVTCLSTSGQAFSTPVMIRTATAPLSGIYTLNQNAPHTATNFTSFDDLLGELYCVGVTGTVEVNVVSGSGPYLTNVVFNSFPNASSTNNIIIHGNGNRINSGGVSPIVSFVGASYYTLDSFRIENDATFTGFGVHVGTGSSNLTFTRNVINVGTTSTATTNAGFVASGSASAATTAGNAAQNITFENNEVIGGYYSFVLVGQASYLNNTGHVIRNNTFRDFYIYGAYFGNGDGIIFEKNDIHRANRAAVSTLYGIYLSTTRNIKVRGNKIHDTGNGSYGAYPNYVTTSVNNANAETEFSNNLVYNINTTSTIYGYYLLGTRSGMRFYYNTVDLNLSSSTGAVRGIFISTAPDDHDFKNNIISIRGTGTGAKHNIYSSVTSTSVSSDYNVLYMNATGGTNSIGYLAADQPTLAAWRAASSLDLNSLSVSPVFANVAQGNLVPLSSNIDNMGTPVSVATDYAGVVRSTTTPDIGAFEFTGIAGDISISSASLKRSSVCYSNADTVFVNVRNLIGPNIDFSIDPLTIKWQVNGPVNSNGTINLNSGVLNANATGTYWSNLVDMSLPGTYTLSAFIEPNNVNTFTNNDTLNNVNSLTVQSQLSVAQRNFTVTGPTDTVMAQAVSPTFPGGSIFITEICHWRGATGAAPAAGWPTYLIADDYIEISGVANTDLSGYILEEWTGTTLQHSYTFPTGSLFSPNGTMIIATGQLTTSVPSPANFYYHSGNTVTHSSTGDLRGYVIKSPGGATVIDAATYGAYTFPAASGVTSLDWSGSTPALSSAGIRLNGPDNNSGSNWVVESATGRQDPNILNPNVPIPSPTTLTGFAWSYLGSQISTTPRTKLGPWTAPGTYTYVASYTNACGTFYDTVIVTATSTVPVKLISFTATKLGVDAKLNWTTASERNASYYEVFASTDGKNFTSIGTVKAKGNTETKTAYQYNHTNALLAANNVFYKLKMIDLDGTFEWSNTAIVANPAAQTVIEVYPNPFNQYVSIKLADNSPSTIEVTNVQGVRMFSTETTTETTTQLDLQNLASGVYFVKVTQGGNTSVQKLIKQ